MLCHECIGNEFVSAWVKEHGHMGTCDYCSRDSVCMPITEVAEHFSKAFRETYHIGEEYPAFWEQSGEYLDDLVSELLIVEPEVAVSIQGHLVASDRWDQAQGEEPFYAEDQKYEPFEIRSYEYSRRWNEFCYSIKHESRFFSDSSRSYLDTIFSDLDSYTTLLGESAIRTVEIDDDQRFIFRGRMADHPSDIVDFYLHASSKLGPPPNKVSRAGRMNPAGISVFYGSYSRETCINELRPPVGSVVMTACFEIIRPIRLLDFKMLEDLVIPTSIFDPDYWDIEDRNLFLRDLHREIRRPILPHEAEIEYLPTQAVAEYLANTDELNLDGILFSPSVTGGLLRNIVLFNKASRIETGVGSQESSNDIRRYRGSFEEILGTENFVIKESQNLVGDDISGVSEGDIAYLYGMPISLGRQEDTRESTLRLKDGSVEASRILSSEYKTSAVPIFRETLGE